MRAPGSLWIGVASAAVAATVFVLLTVNTGTTYHLFPLVIAAASGVIPRLVFDSALTPRQGTLATLTAMRPPARFGGITLVGECVREFTEKPQIGEGWVNGGFMVLEPEVMDYLDRDDTVLESDALERLAADGQLMAYRHDGFWQCMDTLRDLRTLEALWSKDSPPWRVW